VLKLPLSMQGFFVPYLTGGISIVVLAVGSTAPGLLQFAIDKFSQFYPDYRERVLRHEGAHFLVSTTSRRSLRTWQCSDGAHRMLKGLWESSVAEVLART
jgi:hypothetical protein